MFARDSQETEGAWAILTANNKPGKYVEKSLQRELNQFYFQRDELPTMQERFRNASAEEREKLRDISISWLQLKIKGIQQGIGVPQTLTPEYKQFVEGGLYLYVYDAKYKDILPIWDKFPLTIVLEKYNEGFLGLNLHYLDTNIRLGLLGQLIVILDEARRGQVLSLKEKMKHALFVVMSAYATSLVSLLPLYWASAGLFKGFAEWAEDS
jgi:hypothetical protein